MKELSVFIEESDDWGEYDYRRPFYIVTMVFHNQEFALNQEMMILD